MCFFTRIFKVSNKKKGGKLFFKKYWIPLAEKNHSRMSIKKYILRSGLLAIASLLMMTKGFAQSIHFNYTNGTNASYNLQDVRKITFDADVMNLHLLDGSVYAWNVSSIGYYEYDESSVNIEEWLNQANAWDVAVYPNPTNGLLNVQFTLPKEDKILVSLYDVQGKLVLEKNVGNSTAGEHKEMLDLTHLPNGTYVCRISGQQHSITKKVFKQ